MEREDWMRRGTVTRPTPPRPRPDTIGRLQALLDEGVRTGVFPQAWSVILLGGEPIFSGGAGGASERTIFDLASLTKGICTTSAFLGLWAGGTLEPETRVSRYAPESPAGRAGVTLADLLYHRAGLPAFVPFFAAALQEEPTLLDPDCPPETRRRARRAVVERAFVVPLDAPPRTEARYSDVGAILAGEILALASAMPLDELFLARVATPLGLTSRFRRLSTRGRAAGADAGDPIAPTGTVRPREPAPGQEGLWSRLESRPSRPGEVDDDNAWVMDGVAGHAGLFGAAPDVARFGQRVLEELDGAGRIAPRRLWETALRRDPVVAGSTRALGFDTVEGDGSREAGSRDEPSRSGERAEPDGPGDSREGSSAGRFLGRVAPGAVGHLGFTGVSLWIDRALHLVVVLCTNRTARGRTELRIRQFRPRFHDAVMAHLGMADDT